MDDFCCLQKPFTYFGPNDLRMSANLSLSIDRLAKPSRPSEIAALVKATLAENVYRLERAITAGALTVTVPSDAEAVEIRDGCSGQIRFIIGGLPKITETVPFVIDWKKGVLELKLGEMVDGASNEAPLTPFKKLRIVYAEDSPDAQEVLSEMLVQRGHSVTCCDNGQAALREIETTAFDVLITDNHMPRMGGLELVQALRNSANQPKVIVTSAFLDSEMEEQYRSLGVSLFLPKPAPYEEILKAIEDS